MNGKKLEVLLKEKEDLLKNKKRCRNNLIRSLILSSTLFTSSLIYGIYNLNERNYILENNPYVSKSYISEYENRGILSFLISGISLGYGLFSLFSCREKYYMKQEKKVRKQIKDLEKKNWKKYN